MISTAYRMPDTLRPVSRTSAETAGVAPVAPSSSTGGRHSTVTVRVAEFPGLTRGKYTIGDCVTTESTEVHLRAAEVRGLTASFERIRRK